jgi:glycogen synthase
VFAFPSRGEPFGIALLEAMAASVPSVASRAGGVTEFAEDEVNALLVEPDDPGALAHALARVMSDSVLRERLCVAGRATANELSWLTIGPRYEQLYPD